MTKSQGRLCHSDTEFEVYVAATAKTLWATTRGTGGDISSAMHRWYLLEKEVVNEQY